jgi:hypothetical protein
LFTLLFFITEAGTGYEALPLNNRFTLLRLPNALRCRSTATSGILKQLEYNKSSFSIASLHKPIGKNSS